MDRAGPRHGRARGRRRASIARAVAVLALLLLAIALVPRSLLGGRASAQESGGSFGGWDDEPSGGSDWGSSSGSSDWGGSSGSSDWGSSSGGNDYAAQQAAEEEARRAAEAAEAERRRREEEERIARERARKLALPPIERARELTWPERPALAAPSTRGGLDAPLASPALPPSHWAAPEPLVAIDPPASATVVGPMDWGAGACCGAPFLLLLTPLAWLLTRARTATSPARDAPAKALRVSIAFDWTSRATLQSALRAMSARHDMKSRAGLHAGAQAIAQLLSEHAGAARYMTWELARGDARSWFMNRASDLRARFRHELQRNDRREDGPSFVARADEGEGLVVVSVLVASRIPLAPLPAGVDAASLTAVLRVIGQRPSGSTQGLEVIWSPAAESDRMSSYELEQRYPELQRTGDGVGRVQCAYCRAPFPRELGRCPACGAPAS